MMARRLGMIGPRPDRILVPLCCLFLKLFVGVSGGVFGVATDINGAALCAINVSPDETLSLVEDGDAAASGAGMQSLPSAAVPAQVQCAWRCTTVAPCHSFNYRRDLSQCQFFYSPPSSCDVRPNCVYFEVGRHA